MIIYFINTPKLENYNPFRMYFLSLQNIFEKNNIRTKIIDFNLLKIIKGEDIIVTFLQNFENQKFSEKVKKNKVIIINSESFVLERWRNLMEKFNPINKHWDYQYKNLLLCDGTYVPQLYNEVLEIKNLKRIRNKDIFMYGCIRGRRSVLISNIKNIGLNLDINGSSHFDYEYHIKKCSQYKIIVSANVYENNSPIDYYRISPLIANKIFFIHEEVQEEEKNSIEYKILSRTVPFVKIEDIPSECKKWLSISDEVIEKICLDTYNNFKNEMNMENYIPFNNFK